MSAPPECDDRTPSKKTSKIPDRDVWRKYMSQENVKRFCNWLFDLYLRFPTASLHYAFIRYATMQFVLHFCTTTMQACEANFCELMVVFCVVLGHTYPFPELSLWTFSIVISLTYFVVYQTQHMIYNNIFWVSLS